jgi:hypothetical protein
MRLSIWSGGWTIEAADVVLGLEVAELKCVEIMTSLLDNSLIHRDPAPTRVGRCCRLCVSML